MTSPGLSLVRHADSTESPIVYVDDVVRLLGGRKSAWWVRNHFARDRRFKIGRSVAWFRSDADEFLARLRVAR